MADRDNSFDFSDETIRSFLLGRLSASGRPQFEQQLFADAGLYTRVRLVEIDLTDDYALGRLSGPDRLLFQENFLVTATRRRQLSVSDALLDRFSVETITVAPRRSFAAAERLRTLFAFKRALGKLAFGALVLLILFGTVLLVIKEPELPSRIANKIIPRRSPPRSAPREVAHPTNASSPEHRITPSPLPVHESASRSPETILLYPGASDSATTPAVITGTERSSVSLRLAVSGDQTSAYRAEVLDADGQLIFAVERLNGPRFGLDLPESILKRGKYQIRLSDAGDGSKKEVARYYFQIQ